MLIPCMPLCFESCYNFSSDVLPIVFRPLLTLMMYLPFESLSTGNSNTAFPAGFDRWN